MHGPRIPSRWRHTAAGIVAAGAFLAGPPSHAESPPPAAGDELAVGRALYMEGKLASGAPLVGRRSGGLAVEGKQAACVNCHRRSGLGGGEGTSYIPPVTEEYLYTGKHSPPELAPVRSRREDYTGETLARAIRNGLGPAGRQLDYLMPRYELGDSEMKALIAYLRSLSTQTSPGAGADSLRFATVVAPGIDANRKQAMLDGLRACFDDRNAKRLPEHGRMRLGAEIAFVPHRTWVLDLWELEGAPETWPAQLADHAGRKPAFALIAGLGAGEWAPVHGFCEQQGMPCLFPHVEVPSGQEADFYTLYWNRGVLLEAGLIARHLAEDEAKLRRVIQVRRPGDRGAAKAAEALRAAIAGRGIEVEERQIDGADALKGAIGGLGEQVAAVLWLRAEDLRSLEAAAPVSDKSRRVYISGTLGGMERAPVPSAWKPHVLMAYTLELPEKRATRTTAYRRWLESHHVAVTDETLQADVYFACTLLGDGVTEIGNSLYRDFLVERIEDIVDRRPLMTLYPRVAMGQGQRLASKTGYIVRFAAPDSTAIVPVGGRLTP